MADWTTVLITGKCSAIEDGKILLPQNATPYDRVLVQTAGQSVKVLPAGNRSDAGQGACVSPSVLSALGGEGSQIEYREAKWWNVIFHSSDVQIQLAVAILTFFGALITTYNSYLGAGSDATPTFTKNAAPIALLIAVLIAGAKLRKDMKLQ